MSPAPTRTPVSSGGGGGGGPVGPGGCESWQAAAASNRKPAAKVRMLAEAMKWIRDSDYMIGQPINCVTLSAML